MSWLDKYEDGGEFLGTTNKGFDYNGAWGGQFQNGGKKKPIYVESYDDPRYKAYHDSLLLYKGTESISRLLHDNPVRARWEDSKEEIPSKYIKKIINTKKYSQLTKEEKKKVDEWSKTSINPNIKPYKYETYGVNQPKGRITHLFGPDEIMKERVTIPYGQPNPFYKKPEQQVIVKNTPPPSPPVPPVVERPKIEAIQNNLQPEDVVSNFEIEASTPITRREFIAPKYYNVEDVVNRGKSQTNYKWYPRNQDALRELSEESGDRRTMTPVYQNGGSMPGAVGFTYARTKGIPSEGPYAKKTMPSAQNGQEMKYYQEGLDWRPKTISRDGAWLDGHDVAQTGTEVLSNKEKALQMLADIQKRKQGKSKPSTEFSNVKIKNERKEAVTKADNTRSKPKLKVTDVNKLNVRNKTEQELAEQERLSDEAIAAERRAIRERSDANPLNQGFSGFFNSENQTRQNWEDSAAGLESKFRVSDKPNFFDDYLNPLSAIGGMAADLGAAPNQIVQQDSMAPLIGAIATPLLTGAIEGIGAKSNKQFVNNLVNPFNIVPGYKSAEKYVSNRLGNVRTNIASKLKQRLRTADPSLGSSVDNVSKDFKVNNESFYRSIDLDDAISSGVIRSKQSGEYAKSNPYFVEGKDFDKLSSTGSGASGGKPKYIFETPMVDETGTSLRAYPTNATADYSPYIANKSSIPISEGKIYKLNNKGEYELFNPASSVDNVTPTFKSEIDWGKWNKEIPENTQLMNEYNTIEQTTKANGSWMKNPDGSAFQGTPEQFVQQNSENFKKAFPQGSNVSYRGDLSNLSEIKSQQELGKEALKRKYNLTDRDTEALEKLWERSKDKLNSGKYTTNDYEAALNYAKGDKNKVLSLYTDIRNPKFTETGESFRVLEKDRQKLLSEGYDALITKPSSFYPEGENVLLKNNQIKSAIGNNGMFDMTNPNIYKSVLPYLGYTGAGTLTYKALQGQEETPEYKQGGIIKDDRGQWAHPGEITEIGSNDITMQGVPYPVLGISDEGDTKLMKPGKNYKFKGKKVTEFPMAKNGVNQADENSLVKLDQLTNFTNYNKPTGWLDKY